jgi:Ca2+-binding RTX toxin-like protein
MGYKGADTLEGGSGNDEFRFFLFRTDSALATHDTVLDFEGAGVEGGDEIHISVSSYLSFRGEIAIAPVAGSSFGGTGNPNTVAAQAGAGNNLLDVFYTVSEGNTWLLFDDDDNGVLDATDSAIKFDGVHAFTVEDFTESTQRNFVTAGTPKSDAMSGTEDDDILFGLAKNDVILGLGGSDEMYGGAGNDYLDGGTGYNFMHGDGGNDTLTLKDSTNGGDAFGDEGNDTLIGSDMEFTYTSLNGGAGNDTLRAGTGYYTSMNGDIGNDVLVAGIGWDQMSGGSGADLFVMGSTWNTEGFADAIYDFEDGIDRIDLRGSGLTFADLTITDAEHGYTTLITSSAGQLEVSFNPFESIPGRITEADFIFG